MIAGNLTNYNQQKLKKNQIDFQPGFSTIYELSRAR